MLGFPVLKDALSTLNNWSIKLTKLVKEFAELKSPLFWGSFDGNIRGDGTVTYGTLVEEFYWHFRLLNTVFIIVYTKGTLGGSASNELFFTLPVPTLSTNLIEIFYAALGGGGNFTQGFGYVSADRETVRVRNYDASNYATSGTKTVRCAGFYRIR